MLSEYPTSAASTYERFVIEHGPRLRRALVARFGVEIGIEVANDALAQAWARWAEVSTMQNPIGYLFRIAQSAARPHFRWRSRVSLVPPTDRTEFDRYDDGLIDALARLSDAQRVAVLLVHGHGYSYAEVADVLGVSTSAVTNHVHRGLTALRRHFGGSR
ncbi:MAG: RNA polymerase sigma factor [Acidimicrobiia bacterium]